MMYIVFSKHIVIDRECGENMQKLTKQPNTSNWNLIKQFFSRAAILRSSCNTLGFNIWELFRFVVASRHHERILSR